MSIFEIFIVLVVSFLVLKPEDIPGIISKLTNINKSLITLKKEFTKQIKPFLEQQELEKDLLDSEMETINFYLQEITNLGYKYKGNYKILDIKNFYDKIDKSSHNNGKNKQEVKKDSS